MFFLTLTVVAQKKESLINLEKQFKMLDKDKDTLLSIDELENIPDLLDNFENVDIDEDGSINFEEFKLFIKSKKQIQKTLEKPIEE